MTTVTAITLEIPTSIYFVYLVSFAIYRLQAKGVTLWLLAALTLGIATYAVANIFVLTYSKLLINASSSDLITAYKSYKRVEYATIWTNLITLLCSYLVHWIFAMKYWTLACKL